MGRLEGGSVEDSSADSDDQEVAVDDLARWVKMECVEERDGPNEPSPKAQEASNAITIQSDDSEDDHEDDDTQLDDDDSTPRLEIVDRGVETSDTESDTPVQLPGPPKRKYPSRSYNRRAGAVCRVSDQAREERCPTTPLQHTRYQDFDSSDDEAAQASGEEDDQDDTDYDPSQS
ncbi:uncharacterized protein DNG_05461 [Cephalotrichum gorgonifer]|uniref:Uncharacterized protein n=1 Tax=Cephalotrichum gorgonifer TaxID=2041049 RepID=A0AAE8MXY5_9PEZI|nr:uncharacterized protein DNG_05461 [Cephalotrichum gorgonifer]